MSFHLAQAAQAAAPQAASAVPEATGGLAGSIAFLAQGGVALWIIFGLSIFTLALILWKAWRLHALGAWRRDAAEAAVGAWRSGEAARTLEARALAGRCHGARARVVLAAFTALETPHGTEARAREETSRVAKALLAEASSGLRALESVATIAPLLGLFGTVLGMIDAFQALQATGAQASSAALAGGIWEALLTTAAGMAVAIPASAALTWYEGTVERLRLDLEDLASRVFTRTLKPVYAQAAE